MMIWSFLKIMVMNKFLIFVLSLFLFGCSTNNKDERFHVSDEDLKRDLDAFTSVVASNWGTPSSWVRCSHSLHGFISKYGVKTMIWENLYECNFNADEFYEESFKITNKLLPESTSFSLESYCQIAGLSENSTITCHVDIFETTETFERGEVLGTIYAKCSDMYDDFCYDYHFDEFSSINN